MPKNKKTLLTSFYFYYDRPKKFVRALKRHALFPYVDFTFFFKKQLQTRGRSFYSI